MNTKMLRLGIACLLVTLSAGCSTPRPVLQLAAQGVAITAKTQSELDKFVALSNHVYEQRLASVKRLMSGDIEANAEMEFENETARRAGMQEQFELVKLIRELSDQRAQVREKAIKKQADVESTLQVGEPVNISKEKLAELRKAFAELSQEISHQEWLKFSYDYAKQVNSTLKKSKDNANQAEKKAEGESKKLLDKAEEEKKKKQSQK